MEARIPDLFSVKVTEERSRVRDGDLFMIMEARTEVIPLVTKPAYARYIVDMDPVKR